MPSANLSITLDEKLLKHIDSIKGDVPRSRFIQRRLEGVLKEEVTK